MVGKCIGIYGREMYMHLWQGNAQTHMVEVCIGTYGREMYEQLWQGNVQASMEGKCIGTYGRGMYRHLWQGNVQERIHVVEKCIQRLMVGKCTKIYGRKCRAIYGREIHKHLWQGCTQATTIGRCIDILQSCTLQADWMQLCRVHGKPVGDHSSTASLSHYMQWSLTLCRPNNNNFQSLLNDQYLLQGHVQARTVGMCIVTHCRDIHRHLLQGCIQAPTVGMCIDYCSDVYRHLLQGCAL